MRVLVTGGAGFIGSHLTESLCRRGDVVTVLDDLSTGNLNNLSWQTSASQVEFVEGDVRDTALLSGLLNDVDWVFHLAAMPSVAQSVCAPLESNRINLDATLALFWAARNAAVKRVVFASSSAVYGDSVNSPKHEGMPPEPASPYALQKYSAERYGRLFWQLYRLPVVSLRYFNVFGPRQDSQSPYASVIPIFLRAALLSQPLKIEGDGRQTRDFTYVDNIVDASILAASAPLEVVAGQVFNCATGTQVSVNDLVTTIGSLLNREITQIGVAARLGDVRHSVADISLITGQLGYDVRVDWNEGLRRTLEYIRDEGGRKSATAP